MAADPMELQRERQPGGDAARAFAIIAEVDRRFLAGDPHLPDLAAVFTQIAGQVSLLRDVDDPGHGIVVVLDNQQ